MICERCKEKEATVQWHKDNEIKILCLDCYSKESQKEIEEEAKETWMKNRL